MDDELSKKLLEASRMSMGMHVSDVDISNVKIFVSKIISLSDYRCCPPCLNKRGQVGFSLCDRFSQ